MPEDGGMWKLYHGCYPGNKANQDINVHIHFLTLGIQYHLLLTFRHTSKYRSLISDSTYRWSTKKDILIGVKRCVSKSALNSIETFVASECIVSPGRKTGDWLQGLGGEREERRKGGEAHKMDNQC